MNTKIQSQTTINSKKYNFINNNRNFLEFNNLNLNPFIEKFKNKKKFIVAHFGDSHIQPDHLTGYIRKELQNLNGDGGRGMIFPYSIAKTYSQADYKSVFSGKWRSANSIHKTPKIPLGISGFSATTSDSNASFKVLFSTSISSQRVSLYITNIESNYEIKLNALSLSKYSQERQTLTIMHEILHSYFWAAYGNLVTPNQHTRMLNEYIEEMASSLEDLYPQLSENHDVTIALCFDNLYSSVGIDIKNQISLEVFENAINDDKYKKIGLYLTNWESIAEKALYNNDISTLGTKSPCTY